MIVKIVTTTRIPGVEIISDNRDGCNIECGKEYLLWFTNGEVTMCAFKKLLEMGKQIMFYVENFEFFLYKMRLFKDSTFEFVECESEHGDGRIQRYMDIENKLGGCDVARGVEVSFRPDVFGSIRTSLTRPDVYMCDESMSTIIYAKLSKRCKYEDLKRMVKNDHANAKYMNELDFDDDFDRHLRSLMFVGIVKMHRDMFSRWNQ
ncbi:hypothetical protein HK407_01g00440 [Ordospora pajunii]|uniref:uncharacterized protein n=1 Tax=Ordospora pajunii TaxID=3039483 RepID=UPI0029526F0E|nr:uncharacterized protein HK407_01g00440 [Ordospora pajunii]KAH9412152.1 hypothetical protein HK407_01g00440 [Ordospora pajunii]